MSFIGLPVLLSIFDLAARLLTLHKMPIEIYFCFSITEQLNNIRHTLSLANLLCKTTDLEAVQVNPLFKPSEANPKVLCSTLPELNYELWREYGPYKKKK